MILHGGRSDFPDLGEATMGCCYGSAIRGPEHCTCWRPEYNVEQQSPKTELEPVERKDMCHDCAYRFGSPERAEGFEEEWLLDLPASGQRFFCHDNMVRIVRYRHPSGAVIDAKPGEYDAPKIGDCAFQADGTPALLCGGWAARKRVIERQDEMVGKS